MKNNSKDTNIEEEHLEGSNKKLKVVRYLGSCTVMYFVVFFIFRGTKFYNTFELILMQDFLSAILLKFVFDDT